MAAGRQSPFKDLIECRVCVEVMSSDNKPKLLPCLHTVCECCVDKLKECPSCGVPFIQNRAKDLPTNFTILQLVDVTKNMKKNPHNKGCEYCPDESRVISHICKDCDKYFCSDCAERHTTAYCLASNTCLKHQKMFTIVCLDCNILLCTLCAANKVCCTSNNKNKIEDIKVEKTLDLKRMISKIYSQIKINKENMLLGDAVFEYTMNNIEEIKQKIKTHTNTLQGRKINSSAKAVRCERGESLMDKIKEYEHEVVQMRRSVDSRVNVEIFTQLKLTAEAAMRGGIEQILQTLHCIRAFLPDTAVKKTAIMIPGEITFKPIYSMEIGRLHKDKAQMLDNGSYFIFENEYWKHRPIASVCVIEHNAGMGDSLWDVIYVNDSIMAVSDSKNKVVLFVDRQGHILKDSQTQGVEFKNPCGIAYHPTRDCLVVCDEDADCLCMLDPNTMFLIKKVQLEQFSPYGIAVMPNDNIVVTGVSNRKIAVFDMDDTELYSWDTYNNGINRFVSPFYVTVGSDNTIYVADCTSQKIIKMSESGEVMCEWETMDSPCGLIVYGDKVLVAEYGCIDCLREYSVDGTSVRRLLTWNKIKQGFGGIMSVARHNDQLAVIGMKGLRTCKIIYKP